MTQTTRVLTLNIGSSSLKAALYEISPAHDDPQLVFAAHAERLGDARGHMSVQDTQGQTLFTTERGLSDHPTALQTLLDWLRQQPHEREFDLVGHRVVFGGQQYREPQLITDDLVAALEGLSHFDPLHMPQALSVIAYMRRAYPRIAQVACFDTAFHRTMPPVAKRMPIPRRFGAKGVERYGFHGLSYTYLMEELGRVDPAAAKGRAILAHLGNGPICATCSRGNGVTLGRQKRWRCCAIKRRSGSARSPGPLGRGSVGRSGGSCRIRRITAGVG
jgi:acetate kinase